MLNHPDFYVKRFSSRAQNGCKFLNLFSQVQVSTGLRIGNQVTASQSPPSQVCQALGTQWHKPRGQVQWKRR